MNGNPDDYAVELARLNRCLAALEARWRPVVEAAQQYEKLLALGRDHEIRIARAYLIMNAREAAKGE